MTQYKLKTVPIPPTVTLVNFNIRESASLWALPHTTEPSLMGITLTRFFSPCC